MSGHSKWSNIKRKKEVNDKAKASIFAKLSRLITTAVIEGGGVTNPTNNIKLRLIVEKAKEENMPKDNISRAIEKGVSSDKNKYEQVIYEAFGPSGTSFIIVASTDNPNRTSNEMKNILDRNSAKLGNPKSVLYLFVYCGVMMFDSQQSGEEEILEFADSIKAHDIEISNNTYTIYFDSAKIGTLHDNMKSFIPLESPKTIYRPTTLVEVSSVEGEKISQLIEALENLEDVFEVYTNATEVN